MAWLSKQLHKSQVKKIEKIEKNVDKILDVVTRLDERVKTLSENDRTTEHAIKLAILEKDVEKAKGDLNGLGGRLREMSQQ